MNNEFSDSKLTINLNSLEENYKILRKKLGETECAAVVKANAYGTGVKKAAQKLAKAGCSKFFVANLNEAIELRQILPKAEIHIFHGFQAGQEVELKNNNLIPVLNDFYQIEAWNSLAKKENNKLPSIIHFDTGMNRLGLNMEEAKNLSDDADMIDGLKVEYIMSHLACSSEEHKKNQEQLEKFAEIKSLFPGKKATLANSSGIFLGSDFHQDLVRPGIALYGSNPTPANDNPMKNVATVTAKIIQIRQIKESQTVGYGATKEVAAGSILATVPVGYADGYLRHLSNQGICAIGDVKVPVVGRVSMDLIIIDVTTVPKENMNIGTEVELIGRHIPVDLVAKQAGTIGYEILTSLGSRYRREYVGE